jgi:hypothetical protein
LAALELYVPALYGEDERCGLRKRIRPKLSRGYACLRPECNPRRVDTPSKWQARQPINCNSLGRWRRYESVLGSLRPLVEDLPV